MTGSEKPVPSRSLGKQVNALEAQILLRRCRMHAVVTGIKHKITSRMVSATSLLTAAGIGVAMEQTGRHQAWSLVVALNTAIAGIRLMLLAISSPGHEESGNTTNKSTHERTHR